MPNGRESEKPKPEKFACCSVAPATRSGAAPTSGSMLRINPARLNGYHQASGLYNFCRFGQTQDDGTRKISGGGMWNLSAS